MFSFRTVLAISLAADLILAPCTVLANAPSAAPPQGNGAAVETTSRGDTEDDVERVIPVEQLPKAVYAALMRLGEGIEVQQVEMSISKGRVTYEIDLLLNGVYHEVEFDDEGTMIASEVEAWIVSLGSVPAPVRSAFETEAGEGSILEVRKEQEDITQFVFEADIRKAARTYILRIDAQGTLIERDITVDMLPPGAYSSLTCAAKEGTIRELDEELHDGKMSYEANIVVGSKEIEISVDADGKVVELDL
jgi:uncharacterized membrane protein YkoI